MGFKMICCALVCIATFSAKAQKYTVKNEELEASLELKLNRVDSVIANVELTCKSGILLKTKISGCYLRIKEETLYVYVGWDQLSTANYPMDVQKIDKGQNYSFIMKVKSEPELRVHKVNIQLNYFLFSDYILLKKKYANAVQYVASNQIMLADYFQKMK